MRGSLAWIRLCFILFAALMAQILCAAPPLVDDSLDFRDSRTKDVLSAPKLTPATPTPGATTATVTPNPHREPPTYLFSLGTGLAAIDDTAGWMLHWGVMMRPFDSLSLYLGPDLDVHYWGTSPNGGNVTMTGVQAMASGIFAFDLPGTILRSYLGLSMGPFFRNHGGGPIGWSFSAIGRVGMIFLFDSRMALAVEPRLGLLEGDLALQGLLSAHILL